MIFLFRRDKIVLATIIFKFLIWLFIPISVYSNSFRNSSNDSLNIKQDSILKPLLSDTLKENNKIVPIIDSATSLLKVTQSSLELDKIIKRNGDSILCKIIDKNLYEVEYQKPGSKANIKLSTASIKELFYSDGKYELIDNNPEKKKKDWTVTAAEKDWNKVLVTSEPSDVAGMIEKGSIEATFEAKKMNTDVNFLERNAYSILKKKAYSLKAVAVLVVSKTFNRTYGELPNIVVKAVAYGKE